MLSQSIRSPAEGEALEWAVLTTLVVTDFTVAIEKLRWYAGRRGIDVFHRVLKSRCKVETRQFGAPYSLVASWPSIWSSPSDVFI